MHSTERRQVPIDNNLLTCAVLFMTYFQSRKISLFPRSNAFECRRRRIIIIVIRSEEDNTCGAARGRMINMYNTYMHYVCRVETRLRLSIVFEGVDNDDGRLQRSGGRSRIYLLIEYSKTDIRTKPRASSSSSPPHTQQTQRIRDGFFCCY